MNKRRKRNWNRLEKKGSDHSISTKRKKKKVKDKGRKGRGGRKQYLFLVITGVPQGEGSEVSWVKQGGTCSARLQRFNNTWTRRVTNKQSTWRQTRHSNSHTNTSSRSIPHTPRVCSQAMPEVTRDKEMRKSKRGRQLVPVEYTAQGTAHRTQKIYRSCKSDTNISPKHSYTQTACEGLLKVMTNENDILTIRDEHEESTGWVLILHLKPILFCDFACHRKHWEYFPHWIPNCYKLIFRVAF